MLLLVKDLCGREPDYVIEENLLDDAIRDTLDELFEDNESGPWFIGEISYQPV